jgi:hypothetical protein
MRTPAFDIDEDDLDAVAERDIDRADYLYDSYRESKWDTFDEELERAHVERTQPIED